jgi:hypothetical protein
MLDYNYIIPIHFKYTILYTLLMRVLITLMFDKNIYVNVFCRVY